MQESLVYLLQRCYEREFEIKKISDEVAEVTWRGWDTGFIKVY